MLLKEIRFLEKRPVVEKRLTVVGKTLIEHLEVKNLAEALNRVKTLVKKQHILVTEKGILNIHEMILKGVDDENAGFYIKIAVHISGSMVILPNLKVPTLMKDFIKWLKQKKAASY